MYSEERPLFIDCVRVFDVFYERFSVLSPWGFPRYVSGVLVVHYLYPLFCMLSDAECPSGKLTVIY